MYLDNQIKKLENKVEKLKNKIRNSKFSLSGKYTIHKFLKLQGKLEQLRFIKENIVCKE